MSKNRYVNTKFWDDSYIVQLDPIEKLIFIYLLTNPLTNICGIYEISIRRIAFDTGIDKDMVQKILDRLDRDNKMKYFEGWLAIKNFIQHQKQSDNPDDKINKGIKVEMEKAPQVLINFILDPLKAPPTPLNYLNSNLNSNSNLNTNASELPTEDSALSERNKSLLPKYHDIYSNLLKKYNFYDKNLYPAKAIAPAFKQIIKAGYTDEQFSCAVNNYEQSDFWKGQGYPFAGLCGKHFTAWLNKLPTTPKNQYESDYTNYKPEER